MLLLIIQAITWLQPNLPSQTVEVYAATIVQTAAKRDIDPFLVVAQIDRETGRTWNRRLRSRTHDHGLMQVHVTAHCSPMFLGKERKLYNHRVNIRRGVYLLSFFREWHKANCGKHPDHPFWVHYKWGLRRPPKSYVDRVGEVYRSLLERFFGESGEV